MPGYVLVFKQGNFSTLISSNTAIQNAGSRRTLSLHDDHKEKCVVDLVVLRGLRDLH